MLGKLMKYEFKALYRNLGPLYIAWLFMEILFVIIMKNNFFNLPNTVSSLFFIAFIFLSITAVIMTLTVILDKRFYKNLYGDEGYFTLSLPVKTSTQILSKIFSTTFWIIGAGILSAVALVLGILLSVNIPSEALKNFIEALRNSNIEIGKLILMMFELVVLMVLSIMKFVIKFLAAISLGALFNRYKGMMSVIFYIAFSTMESIIVYILENLAPASTNYIAKNINFSFSAVAGLIFFQLILALMYFAITHFVLDKKFNLQ